MRAIWYVHGGPVSSAAPPVSSSPAPDSSAAPPPSSSSPPVCCASSSWTTSGSHPRAPRTRPQGRRQRRGSAPPGSRHAFACGIPPGRRADRRQDIRARTAVEGAFEPRRERVRRNPRRACDPSGAGPSSPRVPSTCPFGCKRTTSSRIPDVRRRVRRRISATVGEGLVAWLPGSPAPCSSLRPLRSPTRGRSVSGALIGYSFRRGQKVWGSH